MRGEFGVVIGCPDRKKGYADRKTAKSVMARLRKDPGHSGKLAAYKCDHCRFWHVGHMPAWKCDGLERPDGYGNGES